MSGPGERMPFCTNPPVLVMVPLASHHCRAATSSTCASGPQQGMPLLRLGTSIANIAVEI